MCSWSTDVRCSFARGLATHHGVVEKGHLKEIHPAVANTFEVMLNLVVFFDYAFAEQYRQAFELLSAMRLLPATVDEVEEKARSARAWPQPILRNLGPILMEAIKCIHRTYASYRSVGTTPEAEKVSFILGFCFILIVVKLLPQLRAQSHALVTFAGMLQYQLPNDTVTRLVQMDVVLR